MSKSKSTRTHRDRTVANLESMAQDAGSTVDAVEDNEIARTCDLHRAAGEAIDGFAPHDPYEHCDLCCELEGCEG